MTPNNRAQLDRDLLDINKNILQLANLVETAVEKAMQALVNRNLIIARQVVAGDEEINALRYIIEEDCYRILATQTPIAKDLRHVIAAMHIATNLERMADHAAGIADLVTRIKTDEFHDDLFQLPKMSNRVQKMIRQAIQAYITRDAVLAQSVIERDEKVNRQYGKFTATILDNFDTISIGVTVPTYMLWIGHCLERIGDRVTNIAERVIFMETGRFVEVSYL